MTVGDAIRLGTERLRAVGVDSPRFDAQLLLMHVLGCRREDLAREPERALTSTEAAAFEGVILRRETREPLPYILGVQEFYGRTFQVDPAVLIPRPETELLVEQALRRLANVAKPRIVDVGVGSGCVAVTLAVERPDAQVVGTDISPAAIAVATSNARALGVDGRVDFLLGDLLTPIASGGGPFHVIVSNPPYVTEQELVGLQAEVRDFEPRLALSGQAGASGDVGIALYPLLFAQAYPLLEPGGWVLVEVGAGQASAVVDVAIEAGFVDVEVVDDLAGIGRVVMGRRDA